MSSVGGTFVTDTTVPLSELDKMRLLCLERQRWVPQRGQELAGAPRVTIPSNR